MNRDFLFGLQAFVLVALSVLLVLIGLLALVAIGVSVLNSISHTLGIPGSMLFGVLAGMAVLFGLVVTIAARRK